MADFEIRSKTQALIQQRRQHPGWRLLAARSAPLVLGCLQVLFLHAEDGVALEDARLKLAELLSEYANDSDLVAKSDNDPAAQARKELRQWIQSRLVIEREGKLYATDALEQAIEFVSALDQRLMTSTASRLSVVQREIEELELGLNPDPKLRGQYLRRKLSELEHELQRVQGGDVAVLDEAQAIERIREIYSLATGLSADFRRVEDSYREADRSLRESIINRQTHRGQVLDELLESHDELLQTPEGQVFHGFFEQLKQDSALSQTREQLRAIIKHPSSRKALNEVQHSELRWLFVRLTRESETVLRARERSENDVRGFLKSNLLDEHIRVGELLAELRQSALKLDWEQAALRHSDSVLPALAVDCANVPLVQRLRLKSLQQDEAQELELSQQQTDLSEIEDDFWQSFDSLDREALWHATEAYLQGSDGPQSLAQLAAALPPSHDLETLAFWLGLAREAEVSIGSERETVELADMEDAAISWRFEVPKVALDAEALSAIEVEGL